MNSKNIGKPGSQKNQEYSEKTLILGTVSLAHGLKYVLFVLNRLYIVYVLI